MAAASAVVGAASAGAAAAGLARLPHGMGMSMSHMAGTAWMGAINKQLELARPALYWPGLQGLVGNPNLWRDRANHSGKLFNFLHLLTKLASAIPNLDLDQIKKGQIKKQKQKVSLIPRNSQETHSKCNRVKSNQSSRASPRCPRYQNN